MSQKHLIHIHAVTVREGVARKTGNAYHIEEGACIASAEYPDREGEIKKDTTAGLLNLPDHCRGLPPGAYEPVFSFRNFEGKVMPFIVDLVPVGVKQAAPMTDKKAA
ncbi:MULTISPECIES: hypothetical protein [unclassified Cupriavidus]|uniref:hypothetical protein n=1 Tax=unclassified Cupriavidus TaxID=2640874 RepID=UPI001C004BA5|nr:MULTISPECIES: hypothetical protein [unclassified Cupriavidus]MCA3182639.1 hypothetical protein [Cupriavidus sp.]MCA3193004.1 hypothetical protein [Cupriavidus sp.]MCA3195856.1 hypothetical protein [Cupriavidus sp.]MCA3204757.1 hypothetical protein [Cupriavidus sp.]MCA3206889.1 hypothetical protein [Cupriavidus sp.]